MKDKWTVGEDTKESGTKLRTHTLSWTLCTEPAAGFVSRPKDPVGYFFVHVSTGEHFPQHRLCGGDAADHGQQACPEKAKRCRATSTTGSRLPRLQLPTAGGKCQLMVVSSSMIITGGFLLSVVLANENWMTWPESNCCQIVRTTFLSLILCDFSSFVSERLSSFKQVYSSHPPHLERCW